MSTYVLVAFWLHVTATAISLVELIARNTWPVEKKISLGEMVARALIGLGFIFWTGMLLWWRGP